MCETMQKYIDKRFEETLHYRLAVIGLPSHRIKPLVELFLRWIQNSGPEWTAQRFKALKVDLIRQKAGLPYTAQYIRKNAKGQYFGIIGALFAWIKESSVSVPSEKRFNIVLQSLNIYTMLESNEETESQLKKFLTGVNQKSKVSFLDRYRFKRSCAKFAKTLSFEQRKIKRGGNSLIEQLGSHTKRAPRPNGLGSVRQDEDLLGECLFSHHPLVTDFRYRYAELYNPVTDCVIGPSCPPRPGLIDWDEEVYGGEVHFLQEPGFKMRAIASPYRVHQLALRPLGTAIYDLVEQLPWDCTFSQEKAIPHVQHSLNQGLLVHSVDLTGATDYFPLGIQLDALVEIFGNVLDIKLVEEISRSKWKSTHGDIVWKTGQPLGLYPSFGMFTLTHGLLLFHLNGNRHDSKFFVVGDDVIILDDSLAKSYKDWLKRNNCPYSSDKSLSSHSLAEFAGKVITSTNVVPSYKWKKVSDDNFLDIAKNFGNYRSRALLTKKQQQVFDVVKNLLTPIGLGFNSEGLPLSVRSELTERFLEDVERSRVRSLLDLSRRAHSLTYESSHGYSINEKSFLELAATLDKRVEKVFSQTVIKRWDLIIHMNDLPEALGLFPRLPLESGSNSRKTTLQRYQQLLANLANK